MTSRFLLLAAPHASHSAASVLDRVADHRSPLLSGCSLEMLAERPPAPIRLGRVLPKRGAKMLRRRPRKLGPARSDEGGVVRVARPGLCDPQDVCIQPGGPRCPNPSG